MGCDDEEDLDPQPDVEILQDRSKPPRLDLRCGAYRAVLMSPDRVSDVWVRWLAEPLLMLPMGVQPRSVSKQQLAQYVLKMHARQRAVIGIFTAAANQHVGVMEVTFDRKHLTATVETLIDTRRYEFPQVARDVLPGLMNHLASRFRIEKFIAMVPETHVPALSYFTASDWSFEAELVEEVPSAALKRRLTLKQFAWFPAVAPVAGGDST